MIKRTIYSELPAISGPYVHAVKHNDTLYVSGLTAFGADVQTRDFSAQTQNILSQIETILIVEDSTKAKIIELTIFVTDISQLGTIRELLFEFYGGCLPACSLFEVSKLIHPDLQIEIECVLGL